MNITYISPCLDSCYSEDTELLTDSGWKFFKDISYQDKLATLEPTTHIIQYVYPDNIIVKQYNGPMYSLSSKTNAINLLVTPNHSMFVQTEYERRKNSLSKWFFEKASETFGKTRSFTSKGIWDVNDSKTLTINNKEYLTQHWLEFLGYYLSEGSSTITKEKHYIVQIRQFKYLQKMANALNNVTPNKINIRLDGRVIVNDKQLCLYLKNTFGNKYNKYIPQNILNSCSSNELKILFEALMLGDGHNLYYQDINRDTVNTLGGSTYSTSSIKLRDNFIELLLKIGFSGWYEKKYSKNDKVQIYEREYIAKEDHWLIHIRYNNNIPFKHSINSNANNFSESWIPYNGLVYCATVSPNHTLYVRRQGMPLWCGNSGYAEAARNHIAALDSVGITVNVRPISFEGYRSDLGRLGAIVQGLIKVNPPGNIQIIHATPQNYIPLKDNKKYNIGYCAWETDKLPPAWVPQLNCLNEIWVPSVHNKEIFTNSGVKKPVFIMPHPMDLADTTIPETGSVANIRPEDFIFYSIFQWLERKNPVDLLKAYLTEFRASEQVCLVLKTYLVNPNRSQETTEIKEMIRDIKVRLQLKEFPKMLLISTLLSKNQIRGLHQQGHCYISLQRCEGFGIPFAEAMAASKPVITTGYGGQVDFMESQEKIKYTMTPVYGMPWEHYTGDMSWAQPDIMDARRLMRQMFNDRERAKQIGLVGRQEIVDKLSWTTLGNRMKDRLEVIEKEHKW